MILHPTDAPSAASQAAVASGEQTANSRIIWAFPHLNLMIMKVTAGLVHGRSHGKGFMLLHPTDAPSAMPQAGVASSGRTADSVASSGPSNMFNLMIMKVTACLVHGKSHGKGFML